MRKNLSLLLGSIVLLAALVPITAFSQNGTPTIQPQVIDDSKLKALTTTIGGANVLPTTRTIPHWWGSTLDPNNGVTYGYNMVGAEPEHLLRLGLHRDDRGRHHADHRQRRRADVQRHATSGRDAGVAAVRAQQLRLDAVRNGRRSRTLPRWARAALSPGRRGNQLQLQDATMRAQFNKTGEQPYHLRLHPNVLPAVTINVPQNQGTLLQSGRGVIFADVNISWWAAQIKNLESTRPTRRTCRST